MDKVVAIHQPNFFPWLGFFDKIVCSDAFVILDDVQFPKKGGSWTNRVKLLVSGNGHWVTASVVRNYSGYKSINEMEFRGDEPWRSKMLRTIEASYKKAPCFDEAFSFFEPLINNPENNVSEYNSRAILTICKKIGLRTNKITWSSKLDHEGASNELLVSLANAVGADTYMFGGGADGYHDEAVFAAAEIGLKRQNFQNREYPQHNASSFQAGLSIIDAVANVGWDGTIELLVASSENPIT